MGQQMITNSASHDTDPWWKNQGICVSLLALAVGATLVAPAASAALVPGGLALAGVHLASRLPRGDRMGDTLRRLPFLSGFRKSDRDAAFIGRNADTGEEIWFHDDEIRQHILVTGSERSLAYLTFIDNALATGSGAIVISSDVRLFDQIARRCQASGRSDDFLVLDGRQDASDWHTIDVFAGSDAHDIVETLMSFVEFGDGDGAMWLGKMQVCLTGVVRYLVWRRDVTGQNFDLRTVRDHLRLETLAALADEERHPEVHPSVRKSIRSHLGSVPGFRFDRGASQSRITLEHHDHLERLLTESLNLTGPFRSPRADDCESPDIDMADVVTNRRILLVLIRPPLHPDGHDLAKFVMGSLNATMRAMFTLPAAAPTTSSFPRFVRHPPQPFLICLDDVESYYNPIVTQIHLRGRSLNLGVMLGCESSSSLKSLKKDAMEFIHANTNAKIHVSAPSPIHKDLMCDVALGLYGEAYLHHRDAMVRLTLPANRWIAPLSSRTRRLSDLVAIGKEA